MTAPPSGARKIAPMPAPMPAATAMRRSCASRLEPLRPAASRSPAEICAAGPSRPPEPPEPMVIAEATSLIGGMRAADAAALVVDGGDGRVGAVALGLGRQREDDQPGDRARPAP